MTTNRTWPKGRGKLGVLEPLIGSWQAQADSQLGPVVCRRVFTRILDGSCVQMDADWQTAGGTGYQEHAVYAPGDEGVIAFWSFTSDGQRSQGRLADASDIHAEAIAFEAAMPAGLARMIYWPAEGAGFNWAVESRTGQGWSRFTLHRYTAGG
jgi:hypothetical protein